MKDCVAGRIFDGGVAIFVPRDPRGNSRVAKPRGKSTRLRYQNKSTRARNPASYAGYPFTCLSLRTDIFLFPGRYILFATTSSEILIAKHSCRKPLWLLCHGFKATVFFRNAGGRRFRRLLAFPPPATFVRQSRRKWKMFIKDRCWLYCKLDVEF